MANYRTSSNMSDLMTAADAISGGINALRGRSPEQIKRAQLEKEKQDQEARTGELIKILNNSSLSKQEKRQQILKIPDITKMKMEGVLKSEYDELYKTDTKDTSLNDLYTQAKKWNEIRNTLGNTDPYYQDTADRNLKEITEKIKQYEQGGALSAEGHRFTPEEATAKDAMSAQPISIPKTKLFEVPIPGKTAKPEKKGLPAVGTPEFEAEMNALPKEKRTPDPKVISVYTKEAADLLGPGATSEQIMNKAKELARKYGWIVE